MNALLLITVLGLFAGCHALCKHLVDLPYEAYSDEFDDSCYAFFNEEKNRDDAEATCQKHNGHLASIFNAKTNAFLVYLMRGRAHFQGDAWIGLTKTDKDKTYIWPDGTNTDDYSNFKKPDQKRLDSQKKMEKANQDAWIERCVLINSVTGLWECTYCIKFISLFIKHPFLCKYNIDHLVPGHEVSR